MRWLWFVASAVCFAIVFRTHSMGLAVLCLLAALVFIVIGVVALVSGRIESRARDASALMGPEEMRRIREIEERKRAAQQAGANQSSAGSAPGAGLRAGDAADNDSVAG